MSLRRILWAAAALLLPSCSVTLAWVPPHKQTRRTILYAYVDDGSSPVNGKSRVWNEETSSQSEDYIGAGTLGDIMSTARESVAEFDGLVTTDGGLLHQKYGIHSPLDRMALTGM